MNIEQKLQNSQEFIKDLLDEYYKDNNFRPELIKNPRSTIEKFSGGKVVIPENINIVIEDQSDKNYLFLNIPQKPDIESLELSDEQLENISGGDAILLGIGIGLGVWAISSFIEGSYTAIKDNL